ncbi:MAG: iron-sulfur cluster assembly accessory protein [Gammaproteobacteria bacterium]|nr:iron-sulfur cluster assembly accessory protein [Gammaproteobacteria bacterium]
MITVTDAAARQIEIAASDDGMKDLALRVAVRQDDTGSLEYGIGFDEIRDDDIKFRAGNVTLVIAPAFREVLSDMTIDYAEIEPGKFHFIFINPNDPNHVAPGSDRDNLDS